MIVIMSQYSIPKMHGGKKNPDMVLAEDELLQVKQPWRGKKQREKQMRKNKVEGDGLHRNDDGTAFNEHRPPPKSVRHVYIINITTCRINEKQ